MTTIPYRIRRSPRARHARIVVDGAGVEVVVPNGFALRKVEPFVNEKRPWIERTLRRLHESAAEVGTALVEDGGEVPYLGERLRLRVTHATRVAPGTGSPAAVTSSTWRWAAAPTPPARRSSAGTGAGHAPRWLRASTRRWPVPA